MGPKTTAGSAELGGLLRARRNELGLTIEQAAAQAGLGSESWRRYEGGSAIRLDKVRGICKALRWKVLPAVGDSVDVEPPPGYTIAWPHGAYDLAKRDKGVEGPRWYVICKSHGTMVEANSGKEGDKLGTVAGRWGWCRSCRAASMTGIWETTGEDREVMDALSVDIGEAGARAFEAGFAWLQNGIEDDIRELAKLPRGTHIGELAASWLHGVLPNRWMMHYDYDFLYRFLAAMFQLRTRAINEPAPCTVSAVDDLALHMILTQGAQRLREEDPERVAKGEEQAWELALNGDDEDVIIALFHEAIEVEPSNNWHFERWFDDYDGDDDDPQYD